MGTRMKKHMEKIKTFAKTVVQKTRLRKGLMAIVAVVLLLQFYFVRELLMAELLFALGFAVVLVLGGPVYLAGWAGVSWLQQPERDQKEAIRPMGESRSF